MRVALRAERAGVSRPVEDLDGDGLSDVVGFTVTAEGGVDLTCRRGTDGSVIARVPTEEGVLWHPVDAGWHAMLLVTEKTQAGTVSLTVRWVERCAVRWTRTFEGRSDAPTGDAHDGAPHFRMTLDTPTGRPAVLLERVSDRTTVSPKLTSSVAVVVSGDDGETIFESDAADFTDELPTMVPLPDVTGDGLGDYGYSVQVPPGSALGGESRLDAYSTEDGSAVWSIESSGSPGAYAFPVRDTTGDGVTELVLSSLAGDESTTAYVDGARGEVLWRNPVGRPYLLRDGVDQLLGLAGVVEEDGTYWVVVSAVRPVDGTARYTVRRALGPSAGAAVSFQDDKLGDVDGDGVLDVVFRAVASYEGDTERVRHLVVSGRTGSAADRDVLALLPNGTAFGSGSFDGFGDDGWSPGSNAVVGGDDGRTLARWTGPTPVAQGSRCGSTTTPAPICSSRPGTARTRVASTPCRVRAGTSSGRCRRCRPAPGCWTVPRLVARWRRHHRRRTRDLGRSRRRADPPRGRRSRWARSRSSRSGSAVPRGAWQRDAGHTL